MQENVLAHWHVWTLVRHAAFLLLSFFPSFLLSFYSLRQLWVPPLQNLIFNPLVLLPLTQLTQTSPASSPYPSSIHCKCLSKRRGLLRWKDELNRRWREGNGMCWTSGCSPQLSVSLLLDLEDRGRLGDPQSTGSNSRWEEKKKPASLCFMNYWVIGLQLLKYTGALFQISYTVYLVLLSIFLRFFFFYYQFLFSISIPPPPHSDLAFCSTETL